MRNFIDERKLHLFVTLPEADLYLSMLGADLAFFVTSSLSLPIFFVLSKEQMKIIQVFFPTF